MARNNERLEERTYMIHQQSELIKDSELIGREVNRVWTNWARAAKYNTRRSQQN